MKDLIHNFIEQLRALGYAASGDTHPDEGTEFARLSITLRHQKESLKTELEFNSTARLIHWRAHLLKGKPAKRFYGLVMDGNAFEFIHLAQAPALGRLQLDYEKGPTFVISCPMPQSVSLEAIRFLITEMGWGFTFRRVLTSALDGAELELTPFDSQVTPDMHGQQSEEHALQKRKAEASGRAADITRAISRGDIARARKLASGLDIDLPDTV